MSSGRLRVLLCLTAVVVMGVVLGAVGAEEEYEPKAPEETGSMARFDVTETPKNNTQGGRDESKDPSKWIMNLVSTKLPPSKRYRRPTTAPPKALAQDATEANDDKFGLSVSPE